MKRPKYQIVSIDELKKVVTEVLEQYDEIQIAYLYGSYAKNLHSEYSDIDIGVVHSSDFKPRGLYFAELASRIEKKIGKIINIDLRIINKAKPRFLFQVINYSKLLYCKTQTFRSEFEIKVLYQYQEIKPMLDMYDNIFITEALKDGSPE